MSAAHWDKHGRGVERNQLPLYPETVCNPSLGDSRTFSFVYMQLSNVLLPSACQGSFSCPLPEQGVVIADFSSGALRDGSCSADNSCITSHSALPSPCTVPARQFGQPAVARAMQSVPLSREQWDRRVSRAGQRGRPTRGGASSVSPGDGAGEEARRGAGTGLRGGAVGLPAPGRAAGIVRAARPPRRYPHPPGLLPHGR